jgi:hypothetical protein
MREVRYELINHRQAHSEMAAPVNSGKFMRRQRTSSNLKKGEEIEVGKVSFICNASPRYAGLGDSMDD